MKFSKTEKIERSRLYLWNRCGGMCEVCGTPLSWDTFQLAHRIPQRKHTLKKYGEEVIHHPLNLNAVCGLRCNDAVSISNHPVLIATLVEDIRYAIETQGELG